MVQGGTFGGVFIDENILGVAYKLDSLHPGVVCCCSPWHLPNAVDSLHPGVVYWVGHAKIPEIPLSTKDPDLLDALGSNGRNLIFITRDKRIRRDKVEREHLMRSAVRAVFLTGTKNMNKSQMAALIDQYWDHIVQKVGVSSGPSLWSLTQRDGLKPIN